MDQIPPLGEEFIDISSWIPMCSAGSAGVGITLAISLNILAFFKQKHHDNINSLRYVAYLKLPAMKSLSFLIFSMTGVIKFNSKEQAYVTFPIYLRAISPCLNLTDRDKDIPYLTEYFFFENVCMH